VDGVKDVGVQLNEVVDDDHMGVFGGREASGCPRLR